MTKTQPEGGIQGEGDYIAGRRFQDAEAAFVEKGPVAEKAREAADALDGPEGPELEAARRASALVGKGGAGKIPSANDPGGNAAQVDRRLDDSLEDSFPASDPSSASPGSD